MPAHVMLPGAMPVSFNRAQMRFTSSIRARPVRAGASLRNNATPAPPPPVELSLHRRDMIMLVAMGAALVVPQPPMAAAAGSEKAFVKMAVSTLEETITGAALPAKAIGQGSWAGCVYVGFDLRGLTSTCDDRGDQCPGA